MWRASLSVCATAVFAAILKLSAQAPTGVGTLLDRVAERIALYYERAQQLMCTETLTVQPIGADFSLTGFARVTEYELRVESNPADSDDGGPVHVARRLTRVNGRPPRERDDKARESCTDANPLSPEPLSFLLPAHRDENTFVLAGPGKGRDKESLIIDYASPKRPNRGELQEDPRGREDCFSWTIDATEKGRVYVNATTYEVSRLESHLNGLVDVRVPEKLQRKYLFNNLVVIERADTTIRYKPVTFKDPDETLLLPESIETVDVHRGGLQPTRRRHVFTNYRRFLTGGRIIKE